MSARTLPRRALPQRKIGRRKVWRAQLARMDDGRLWCVACCASSPPPPDDLSYEQWRCAGGHGYWYESETETVEGAKAQLARLERLRTRTGKGGAS